MSRRDDLDAPLRFPTELVGAGVAATSTGPMLAFAGVLALFAAFIVASDATLRSFTSATSGSA